MISLRSTFQLNTLSTATLLTMSGKEWLIGLEQSTPVVQIKGSVRDSAWTLEFDMKNRKKAEGHIGRNIVSITIKMKTIVQYSKQYQLSYFISEN